MTLAALAAADPGGQTHPRRRPNACGAAPIGQGAIRAKLHEVLADAVLRSSQRAAPPELGLAPKFTVPKLPTLSLPVSQISAPRPAGETASHALNPAIWGEAPRSPAALEIFVLPAAMA
jgi:hypothetical protein